MTALKTLLVAAALIAAPAAHAADLTLTFPGLTAKTGTVMIAVYDSPESWASGKPTRAATASAADALPTAKLEGLPDGTYAVRAIHDVDGDGKLGRNPFGIPTEPYGFSNDAPPVMGPPAFEAAAFPLKGAVAQAIHLN